MFYCVGNIITSKRGQMNNQTTQQNKPYTLMYYCAYCKNYYSKTTDYKIKPLCPKCNKEDKQSYQGMRVTK